MLFLLCCCKVGYVPALQAQNALKWSGLYPVAQVQFSENLQSVLHEAGKWNGLNPLQMAAALLQFRQPLDEDLLYQTNTKYLFVVTTDGLRWQEVFNGIDSTILADRGFTADPAGCRNRYGGATPEESRRKLMPFLWSVLASKGQIYGNRQYGNEVNVANRTWLSYPGYNELFTGNPDDEHIKSNKKVTNPNTNVLEFLNKKRGFHKKVAAFTSWDAFPYILNEKRSDLSVNAAWENVKADELTPFQEVLNKQQHEQPRKWDEYVRLDFMTYAIAKAYIQTNHPKVTFIGFDETDEYAHAGKYDPYLDAAHEVDARLADLWNTIQQDPVYKGKSALIVTVDHGRGGSSNGQWCNHGPKIAGADQVWFAVASPDTPPTGEQKTNKRIWQKQLAQTMAGMLGYRFHCEHPVGSRIF